MRPRDRIACLVGAALLASALPLAAQAPPRRPPRPNAAPADSVPALRPGEEPKLVFDREVFSYPAGGRRDPFVPLLTENEAGPRFEELVLRGIIHSPAAGQSVALIADSQNRVFRVRRGDRVGNARIVEISPMRVVFAVEDFGQVRQETLELKRRGAQGAQG